MLLENTDMWFLRLLLSNEHNFPFYAGHVADKGFLYLKQPNRKQLTGKFELLNRPYSLADQAVISRMKAHIKQNVSALKKGKAVAYALDDEPSLGTFVNPCDVDVSKDSVRQFRSWMKKRYKTIDALNAQWDSGFRSFNIIKPIGFEQIRRKLSFRRFSGWNLSAWMDFREFMDIQFAETLKELVAYSNTIDPCTPAGIVGGQAPAPWGGYDYGRLSRAVQSPRQPGGDCVA